MTEDEIHKILRCEPITYNEAVKRIAHAFATQQVLVDQCAIYSDLLKGEAMIVDRDWLQRHDNTLVDRACTFIINNMLDAHKNRDKTRIIIQFINAMRE